MPWGTSRSGYRVLEHVTEDAWMETADGVRACRQSFADLPESLSDQRMIEDEDNETVSDLG